MAPPPKPASGLSGIFGAFSRTELKTKRPGEYPRGVEPLPDAMAELLTDTMVFNTVDQAIGIVKNDLNQRLSAFKVDLATIPASAKEALEQQLVSSFIKLTGDQAKGTEMGQKLAARIVYGAQSPIPEGLRDRRGVPEREFIELKANPADFGKWIANPAGQINKIFDEFEQERTRNKKLKRAYDVLRGGNSHLETAVLTVQASFAGLGKDVVPIVQNHFNTNKAEFSQKMDALINSTADQQQKAKLQAFKSHIESSGLNQSANAFSRLSSWWTYSAARTQDQAFWGGRALNFGLPLTFMFTGELPGTIPFFAAPAAMTGYGAFAKPLQAIGKHLTIGDYKFSKNAPSPDYKIVGAEQITASDLTKAVSDAQAAYDAAVQTRDPNKIRIAQDALQRAQYRQKVYAPYLASPKDSVRLYNKGMMGNIYQVDEQGKYILDAQGNPIMIGHSATKEFMYHWYALHPKQWIDGMISGKQWARLISLKNSNWAFARDIGFRAERFVNGQFYGNVLSPFYSFTNGVRGAFTKYTVFIREQIVKLMTKVFEFVLNLLKKVLGPILRQIGVILAKLGLNSLLAVATAGGSLVLAVGYEAINFVTFGALDKVVLKGLKFMVNLTVLAVMLVFGTILLCVGAIATIGPQALQGVGSQWVPIGGATLEFGGPAGQVRPVGGFVCPFGSGGLRCTQGPYGCYSHAQCSNGTLGGGTCRSYEYAVDISLPLGAQIVAPETGRVTRSGDMACAIPPGASSIGGYIEFLGAQSGLTYKFFHVRGSVTGQVNAGAPIGVASMPSGGPNKCWTGAHSHSSVSGQNAEKFYTNQPVNSCQFSCGAPNCTPTN